MIIEITCTLLLPPLLILALIYFNHVISLRNYPRGPFPMPLIGNLHQLGNIPYKGMKEIAKKYGPVYSVSFGSQRVVVINAIEEAKEALLKHGGDFAGRPRAYIYDILSRDYKTISLAEYGPFYTTIKKIGHSALKVFGDGTKRIEKITTEESEYLHQRLLETEGTPVDVAYKMGLSGLNIICELSFGKRFTEGDEEFKEVVDFTRLIFAGLGASDVVAVFPWLAFLPLEGVTKLREGIEIRDRIYRKKLIEHRETFDENNIRDIMDSIIKVVKDEKVLNKTGLSFFTDDHIEMIVNDIFVGGAETTNSTLRWAMVYLLHWPQYQDDVYNEIKQVCGDEYPTYADRPKLHLTYAVILEIMRMSSLAPLGFPRNTTCDTVLNGQPIPKDTQVLFNIWAIHNDERHWDKPDEFIPNRFLDSEGKYVIGEHPSFLLFGAGRRQCFGEAMAKMEIFVILSRLLRDFKIEKVPGKPLPSLQGNLGVTLTPEPFKVVFRSRNNNA